MIGCRVLKKDKMVRQCITIGESELSILQNLVSIKHSNKSAILRDALHDYLVKVVDDAE